MASFSDKRKKRGEEKRDTAAITAAFAGKEQLSKGKAAEKEPSRDLSPLVRAAVE